MIIEPCIWQTLAESFYKDCNSGLNGSVNSIKTKILINATNCKADYIFDRNKVST